MTKKRGFRLNYMVDFHGVLDKSPNLFRNMLSSLITGGNQIYICTGSRSLEIQKKLTLLGFKEGIHYNHILSLTDYFEKNLPPEEIEYDVNNNLWVDDTLWWSMKGNFCKAYKIDVIFDDRKEYFIYTPENVLKFHVL